MAAEEHYRWNVNPAWEHFSSLVREAAEVKTARSDFHRYHHLRSALYFAIGSIEAFLNQRMREKMKQDGVSEQHILTTLKGTRFQKKAREWPSQLVGKQVALPTQLLELLVEYNSLRGEVTHAKAEDHSIYLELDRLALFPEALQTATAEYFVRVLVAMGRPYWYWLHGCNFIGMNGSVHWPTLSNNQQFMMALRHIGFNVPHILADEMDAWERHFMTSWK